LNKNITFLTEKTIDRNKLLQVTKTSSEKITDIDDKLILNELISLLESNIEFLTPQEIQFLNSNSQDLWTEYLIFRYKFNNFPKKYIVSSFPIYVLIEPVSACNLRCIMCYQIDESFSSDKNFMGKMDISLFKKIIDECQQGGTKAITMASRGEPTLHPQLGEMLEYCSGKFLELKLNTNATRLTDELCHKILKSGITDIVFSVDSYSKEEYESIRVNGIFENILNNIKRFKEIKDKYYPGAKCATRISGVRVNKSQNPQKFKEFWQQYVDHVVMIEMDQKWDTYNNPIEVGVKNPCHLLWEKMYIWYDGTCNPCDADYKSILSIGSIKNNSIKELWHSQKYAELRKNHLNNNRSSCYPCNRCPVES